MQESAVVYEDIGELLTLQGVAKKDGRRVQETDLSCVADATIVSYKGRIAWMGTKSQFSDKILEPLGGKSKAKFQSFGGKTVIPSFIEPHTHLVFAGNRANEFEMRMKGATYQEISAAGGGILATVKATRSASVGELTSLAQVRLDKFLSQGVTWVESKSGYGLDLDTEIKILKVARSLRGPRIVNTYLGPHSRSPDFPDLDSYMQFVLDEVLPKVAKEKLAERADIYIERGFFNLAQAKLYFTKARELGLAITAHVEQLSDAGGAALALEFNPQSVDHVVFINDSTISACAASDTTSVLLPASDFYLKMRYPPARALIDAGARVALSTDFNPGTSPTQDLSFVGVLARLEMKMTLPEVITAFTYSAAAALGHNSDAGSLSIGKLCDFNILECSWRDLFYSVGAHPIAAVIKDGECVWKKQ